VGEIAAFGEIIFVGAGGMALALASVRLSERVAVPAPAVFLILAALASDLFPRLGELSFQTVERMGVAALIPILFDGGLRIGWRRFRATAVPIGVLGIGGTFMVAAVVAAAAHFLVGFTWTTAAILAAALAPTDPAVMFSVLGRRAIAGPTRTILEGEAGINDPVGIALTVGVLDYTVGGHGSFTRIGGEFVLSMVIGLAVGLAAALLFGRAKPRLSMPTESLDVVAAVTFAALVYAAASVAHGSGFLAVFVAGLALGDGQLTRRPALVYSVTSLAAISEIVVFVALGLTVHLGDFATATLWRDGFAVAVILILARAVVVGVLLAHSTLAPAARAFVAWGGLKGAVPILLATFAVLRAVEGARHIYDIVFFVVMFSVLVQGTTIAAAAHRFGVPVREELSSDGRRSAPPEPARAR
jgi:cell volume regulation protein A